jgi:hypothetical protein
MQFSTVIPTVKNKHRYDGTIVHPVVLQNLPNTVYQKNAPYPFSCTENINRVNLKIVTLGRPFQRTFSPQFLLK